jgi:xanthine dehydrogenase accessory factor
MIHRAIVEMCDRGGDFAVAVVLEAQGSTPCKAGAKAIIDATGAIHGTIGGGAVEAEAQRRAVEVIRSGRVAVFRFDLDSGEVAGGKPICGGMMRVLIDPTARQHRAAYASAAAAGQSGQRGLLLTAVAGVDPWEVTVRFLAEDAIPPEFPVPDEPVLRVGQVADLPLDWQVSNLPRVEVLIEPVGPRPLVVIVGGGHVGQALAVQARLVGFEILVIDDRPEFAEPSLFPAGTATRCGPIGEVLAGLPLDARSYVVIVTRGHQHDAEALAACLHQPAAYIGMIGSRRKVALMRGEFVESGRATAAEFDRVWAPIGLDIGAATVPEIATSIVAQLIAVRRKGESPRI